MHHGASVVILDGHGSVLLVKREDFRMWTTPGGWCDPGETFEEAAIREAWEESGYQVGIDRHVGDYTRLRTGRGKAIFHLYAGHIISDQQAEPCWETVEVRWWSVDGLPRWMTPFCADYIADAIANHAAPVQCTQSISILYYLLMRTLLVIRNLRNCLMGRA